MSKATLVFHVVSRLIAFIALCIWMAKAFDTNGAWWLPFILQMVNLFLFAYWLDRVSRSK